MSIVRAQAHGHAPEPERGALAHQGSCQASPYFSGSGGSTGSPIRARVKQNNTPTSTDRASAALFLARFAQDLREDGVSCLSAT